ncbi:mevalonate kinase [Corynespora cassiicola Philippines]|uniref:Mevalonate kinase n=1 Tax=Corynespora cassiicola Philippines TaxID=1448308 RepID=A0A2T2PDK5_CORCC|nr:mevalonate kinase [Corynespora cassiicola Philippines]
MPSFMVSAPGKVILFGEHAVVYNKAAVAAAISLRSYLLVTSPCDPETTTVSLCFPDIGLNHSWDINELPWEAFSAPGKKRHYSDIVTTLDPDLGDALQPHVQDVGAGEPQYVQKTHQASAFTFLYLFLSLRTQNMTSCSYTLRSTIPVGAGLGSSASVTVCLATALLLQMGALENPHRKNPLRNSEFDLEYINRWAFVGEMCHHGNPSGVDNTVSSGGKAIYYQLKNGELPVVTPLLNFPELPLLIVNTKVSRRTAVEVAKVRSLKHAHPVMTEHILNAVHEISKSAYGIFANRGQDCRKLAVIQHLGDLVTVNHSLLLALGVSHPKIERIRALVKHSDVGWTKLTGAGGGGCTITILKPGIGDRNLQSNDSSDVIGSVARKTSQPLLNLRTLLKDEGFESYEATIASNGVSVLWPATLYNGEAIDQETFLKAQGSEGLERLVGMNSKLFHIESDRLGWKSWRQ